MCWCAALLDAFFRHALSSWPTAAYIGKTEDDIFVALPALVWELDRLPAQQRLWWGLMAWTGSVDADEANKRQGCWGGGFEDDPVLSDKGDATAD